MATLTFEKKREFNTPLGAVRCGFFCDRKADSFETKKYENGSSEIFKTGGHKIEVITFKVGEHLAKDYNLTDRLGWIFRIEKIQDIDERIETYCLLDKISDEIYTGPDTGENLDAIMACNTEWILHIGTEDGTILNSRSEKNDWFPLRLKSSVNSEQSITEMKQNGFLTKIPELKNGEKIHIQYLTAYDTNDDNKINTWLAVDDLKGNLENWIGIL